ncbi:protein NLRC3-like [Micropterus dolomieu]|uniref:protein NLRC3-like n=1 Tax=Micropterus dolomieu TaxID=147949 RepID=UPI001E8DB0B0|nr:protein NLRC3-like [Micropterus dolomieu]
MAEKKRKRPVSSLTADESVEPNSACSEPSVSVLKTTASTAPSFVSMKSDGSKFELINFGFQDAQRQQRGEPSSSSVCLEDPVYLNQRDTEEDMRDNFIFKGKKNLKEAMKKQFTSTYQGHGEQQSSLNSIYTSLYITTGESGAPHEEHAFRHIKHKLERQSSKHINLSDIFKPLPGQEKPPRTVLTKGVAGIGKSFAVQKFILDWAEEKENQDIDFVFNLAFRELNLSSGNKSLHQLLTEFHPALHDLKDSEDFIRARVLVILDGLDESRLQLDFENKPVTSVSEITSVGNLLTNLIQGNLLPEANLWITSRPAAANQIAAEFVDKVMEIRGFSDPQKEEYFRRRFHQDLGLADRIISHIRSSQSLDIMCQIPIFCWISAVLFQEIFGGDETAEVPQTLTEMMAHFLFAQTKRRSRKYEKKTERNKETLLKTHKEFLLKLGKLAFVHLQKNNLIFYDEDLEECGIDIKEAAIYSGLCNTVLREEDVFSQKKVFFFVHLTIQEFFAALFVYDCFTNKNTKELGDFLDLKDKEHTLNLNSVEHGGSDRIQPGFKKYACELTWDPNTAHKNLLLSEGNRKVTWVKEEQPHHHHQERFDQCQRVLCEQGLDGRCYWEVEVFGLFSVGVTYRGADKEGKWDDFKLGHNDKSWCLVCSNDGYYILHCNNKVDVSSLGWRSSQVGVFLDWPAGTLSFYRVSSDSRVRLHTFKTKFSEPLYPAVELHTQSSAAFSQI